MDNPTRGVRRIVAELTVPGQPVSAATVYRYRGTIPAPAPTWRTFLRLHAPEIWAADFFTVQTLTFKTIYGFFLISHDRRRIMHWNVTAHPTAPWVWRQIIAATPWNRHPRFLIRDRDRNYGGDFVPRGAALGIATVLTPVRAPKANASTWQAGRFSAAYIMSTSGRLRDGVLKHHRYSLPMRGPALVATGRSGRRERTARLQVSPLGVSPAAR